MEIVFRLFVFSASQFIATCCSSVLTLVSLTAITLYNYLDCAKYSSGTKIQINRKLHSFCALTNSHVSYRVNKSSS